MKGTIKARWLILHQKFLETKVFSDDHPTWLSDRNKKRDKKQKKLIKYVVLVYYPCLNHRGVLGKWPYVLDQCSRYVWSSDNP